MLSVKIAAIGAGLIFMSSVTVRAMEFEDRHSPSYPPTSHSVRFNAAPFSDHPGPLFRGTPLFTSSVTVPAMKFSDHLDALPPGTPLFIAPVVASAMNFGDQSDPLPPGTPLFVSSSSAPAMKFADAPGPLFRGIQLFISPVAPSAMQFAYDPRPIRINNRAPFSDELKSADIPEFKTQHAVKVRVQYVGPAPLDDCGSYHLAMMNRGLEHDSPLTHMVSTANELHLQRATVIESLPGSLAE